MTKHPLRRVCAYRSARPFGPGPFGLALSVGVSLEGSVRLCKRSRGTRRSEVSVHGSPQTRERAYQDTAELSSPCFLAHSRPSHPTWPPARTRLLFDADADASSSRCAQWMTNRSLQCPRERAYSSTYRPHLAARAAPRRYPWLPVDVDRLDEATVKPRLPFLQGALPARMVAAVAASDAGHGTSRTVLAED